MWHYCQVVMRFIEHMDTQEWLVVFLVALGIGAVCMRGFGSRSNY